MTKKVADVIVEVLEQAGVKHCYGIVGDTLNLFAHSLDRTSIEWVHMRHEESGAFAAQGEALLTGDLTAVAGSCGPGSLHFINGLYEANRNRAPVILIASQIVRDEIGFDFVQEVDFEAVYRSCSVYCSMVLTPEQARRKAVIACQTAIAKRGVAVLIVPVDISSAKMEVDIPYSVHTNRPLVRPTDADLQSAAGILNAGKKIAIFGGSGCAGAHGEIMQIADRLRAPVAHTSRGKDALAYDNPHDIGMTGIIGNEAGYHALLECDTLLLLGADFAWRQFYPEDARIVQIDIEPSHLGRRHPIDLGLVGNIKESLSALLPLLDKRSDSSFHDAYVDRHTRAMVAMREKAEPKSDMNIPPTHLTDLINRLAAPDALFTSDDGTPTAWMYRFIEVNGRRKLFASMLHGTMAGALPTSLGLKKAAPERQVIALCGDGGISMLFGELMTAVQENLAIKIVVYDNARLGFVEMEQKAEGMLDLYTDLKNPDFGEVARAIGFWGRTVDRTDDLQNVIIEWLAQPGPALLNVKVNPIALVVPPFTQPQAVFGTAIYSARAVLHGRGRDVLEMVKENFL